MHREILHQNNLLLSTVLNDNQASRGLDTKRLKEIDNVILDELRTNPIIDEQVRMNGVIMNELKKAISKYLKSGAS